MREGKKHHVIAEQVERKARRTGNLQSRAQRGVTLLELLVVVAIVAVLVTLALPGFQRLVENYRTQAATQALISSIYMARSEATLRGGAIVLQKTANPSCPGAGIAGRWECGWHIFLDANGNGVLDAGEQVLQTVEAMPGVLIQRSPAVNTQTFNRWGRVGLGIFNYSVIPQGDATATPPIYRRAKLLCMSSGGRLREVSGVAPPCPR